ncbi:MAG: hypothetical protein EBZ75_11165 [Oxalobacteraceae bacterium]|nr:hypothetical protein [Oxalobacteraceae bacterium]
MSFSLPWTNAEINSGQSVALQSGAYTTMKGGMISSTQAAVDANRNTSTTDGQVSTTDIGNRAHYQAESVSVNLGTGVVSRSSFSIARSIARGIACGVACGVAFGVSFRISFCASFSIAFGVASSCKSQGAVG